MNDGWIIIPNWDKFQHYRDRNPPWIKLYTDLAHRDEWCRLTNAECGLLVRIWIEYALRRGQLRYANVHRMTPHRVSKRALDVLEKAGFIEVTSHRPEHVKQTWSSRYVSESVRLAVLERDGHECRECGTQDVPFEIDHIVPISRGGNSEIDNLQTLCRPCNRRKHNRDSVSDLSSIPRARARARVETETETERDKPRPFVSRSLARASSFGANGQGQNDLNQELLAAFADTEPEDA